MKLSNKILIGLILGMLLGLILSETTGFIINCIEPFGSLFLNLMKMIIVPLIFSALVVGVVAVDFKKLAKMGGKTVGYFLLTTTLAITLGMVIANVLNPGEGVVSPENIRYAGKEALPLAQVFVDFIPINPLKAFLDVNIIQIMVMAIFTGVGIRVSGNKGKPVYQFFAGLTEVMYTVTGLIMEYAPIGVFALLVPVLAVSASSVLFSLIKVIGAVYLACFIHAALVYSAAIKTLTEVRPTDFFRGIFSAQLIAFATCSRIATLPAAMKAVEDNLGVKKEVSSLVMPLGATINMDGTAIYQGVCVIFVAQVFGIELTFSQLLMAILTATFASISTAGVPGASLIILTLVLKAAGLPLEGIALIAGIDRILDRARTTLDLTGGASAAVIINASEDKNLEK